MPAGEVVLDFPALGLGRGERMMPAGLKDAHRTGIRVLTSAMALIEAYHEQVSLAAWSWAMSRVVVEPVTRDVADAAITLLKDTGLHGHKYAELCAARVAVRGL